MLCYWQRVLTIVEFIWEKEEIPHEAYISCTWKTAASVLLELFINGIKRCHTTDAPRIPELLYTKRVVVKKHSWRKNKIVMSCNEYCLIIYKQYIDNACFTLTDASLRVEKFPAIVWCVKIAHQANRYGHGHGSYPWNDTNVSRSITDTDADAHLSWITHVWPTNLPPYVLNSLTFK